MREYAMSSGEILKLGVTKNVNELSFEGLPLSGEATKRVPLTYSAQEGFDAPPGEGQRSTPLADWVRFCSSLEYRPPTCNSKSSVKCTDRVENAAYSLYVASVRLSKS